MRSSLLCISIIEASYLVYMFRYFKTTVSFNHPLEFWITKELGNYWEHPIGSSDYENKICPFGHNIIFLLAGYIIIRNFMDIPRYIHVNILKISFFNSLANMNAVIYLAPFIILEYFLMNKSPVVLEYNTDI